jgi:flagellar hook-length control protein FliK
VAPPAPVASPAAAAIARQAVIVPETVITPSPAPATTAGAANASEPSAADAAPNATDRVANQDAPMTGDDSSQGQGRRSPEFMRFAAALAHVAAPAADDAGRPVAGIVAPAAPAAAASTSVAAVTAPVAVAPPHMTPDAENIGRLVQAMRVNARPGAWEATVRLNPEHLGDVTIALRVDRNSVSAVVNAEASGVRQWLESQEQAVRSGMAEHGLQLERFVVQRDGQRKDAQPQEQESRRRPPKRATPAAERFEVVV